MSTWSTRRRRVPARLQDGAGGDRVEAVGIALSIRTLAGLAQVQEPARACDKTRSAAGLGAIIAMKALVSVDRPVVRIWHPDDPKQYVELQFESQEAANNAVEQLNSVLIS